MPLGQGSINGARNVFMFGPPEDADENYIEIQSHALIHEIGHTAGEREASCINDLYRGSAAWCDSDPTVAPSGLTMCEFIV